MSRTSKRSIRLRSRGVVVDAAQSLGRSLASWRICRFCSAVTARMVCRSNTASSASSSCRHPHGVVPALFEGRHAYCRCIAGKGPSLRRPCQASNPSTMKAPSATTVQPSAEPNSRSSTKAVLAFRVAPTNNVNPAPQVVAPPSAASTIAASSATTRRRSRRIWGGRPKRAKTYGKKREHGLNSRDFDLTRPGNVPLSA